MILVIVVGTSSRGQNTGQRQKARQGSTPEEGKHKGFGTKTKLRKNHILKIHMNTQDMAATQENTEGMYTLN